MLEETKEERKKRLANDRQKKFHAARLENELMKKSYYVTKTQHEAILKLLEKTPD